MGTFNNNKRQWRYHKVDENLQDSWLEELNSLKLFSMTSICEGHPRSLGPHVCFRLKVDHFAVVLDHHEELIVVSNSSIEETFKHELDSRVSIISKIHRVSSGVAKSLLIQVSMVTFESVSEFNGETRNWFDRTVDCIKRLDALMYDKFVKWGKIHE